jgi:tetratricopeptide (TPR) repeat protein
MGRKTRWILPGIGLVAIITVSHLQQDKTESIFRANIGRYYLAAGVSLELGIQFLRDGILGAPEHLGQVFYVRYGETAWFSGISTEDVLEKGMEVFPGDTEIALLHEVSGYISSSRTLPSDYIERVRRTNPQTTNSIGTALNNAGSYHYNRGDYRLAEQLYASAIRVDPGYLGAIVKFANALLHQGELGDAIIAFDRFFELNKGTFGDAIPGLRFFVETEPHNLRARSHLARAYASVANLAEAEKHIYVGLELAGDNEDFIEECVEIAEMIRKTGDIEAANAIHQRIHQP